MRRVTRYQLQVKSIGAPPTAGDTSVNPAMMQRTAGVEMDEGRPWSGEVFEEGATSDPAEAFARFTGEDDTEAWLDKNEDGTLIAWVREGDAVWRYSDVDAWALDVDGAQMQTAEQAPPVEGEGAEGEGVEDPEAFDAEADPAVDEADPTAAVEDPTDLPDEDGDGEDLDNPFADDDDEDEGPDEDPEDPDAEAGEDPDGDGDAEEDTDGDGDGEDPDAETDPDDDPDDDVDDEDDEDDVTEADRLFKRGQSKHMPGHHNQESHGDWSDGIAKGPKRVSGSGGGGAPKGPAPKKASVAQDTISQMSDEELAALTESDDLYEYDTMLAAAQELDSRQPLDEAVRAAVADNPSPAGKTGAFDAVIPHEWSAWVATGDRPKKRNKQKDAREAYDSFVADAVPAGARLHGRELLQQQGIEGRGPAVR